MTEGRDSGMGKAPDVTSLCPADTMMSGDYLICLRDCKGDTLGALLARAGRVRLGIVALVTLGALLLAAAPAFADHEPNHRYHVWGYVKDKTGKPFAGEKVTVKHEKTGQTGIGVSGGNGRYEVKLHLHDDNLGDELTVSVKGAIKKAEVKFDPKNVTTERFGQVDLAIENRTAPAPPPPLYQRPSVLIGTGAGFAAILGLVLWTGQNRKRRREQRRAEQKQQAASKGKKKKRR